MLPCGTYNESYQQDTAIVRTKLQWGLLIGFLIILFTLPLFTGRTVMSFMNMTAITIITVLGLNILVGNCGQISLSQAAFMAVGAYAASILAIRFEMPFWVCIPCGGLAAALIGTIFGLPSLRVRGFYLALATLAAHFLIMWTVIHPSIAPFTGGTHGMVMPVPKLGGFAFDSIGKIYLLIMAVTVLMTFFAKNILRTRAGRAFIAVRDNDIAAEVLGINIFYYKLLAFFICSFYAGVAGSLLSYHLVFVSPDHYPLMNAILYLGMIIIGGLGSILGSILGAVFIRSLGYLINIATPLISNIFAGSFMGAQVFAALGVMVYGLVIILFLIFEPRGLAHRWELFKSSYRLHPFAY